MADYTPFNPLAPASPGYEDLVSLNPTPMGARISALSKKPKKALAVHKKPQAPAAAPAPMAPAPVASPSLPDDLLGPSPSSVQVSEPIDPRLNLSDEQLRSILGLDTLDRREAALRDQMQQARSHTTPGGALLGGLAQFVGAGQQAQMFQDRERARQSYIDLLNLRKQKQAQGVPTSPPPFSMPPNAGAGDLVPKQSSLPFALNQSDLAYNYG